ncbi:MAG: hypothetical protein DRI95_14120 [Bacteroidetes bacterium]|nr:MAG: hypothetical protein DRI95_14120 [Bacteroidota bacterium]
MTLNLKFILITELALLLNFSGLVILDDVKDNDKKKEKKGKKLTPIQNPEFSIRPVFDWHKQYEKTLEYIKDHEGFAGGNVYVCPGGHNTIGYGHIILENENFSQITKQQADSLLRADFNKAIRVLNANIELDGPKRLAMAHFVFAKGIGSFNRSTLKKKILNNEPIDAEITKWCYYTNSKGEKVKSKHALNIRKWELDLYNFRG